VNVGTKDCSDGYNLKIQEGVGEGLWNSAFPVSGEISAILLVDGARLQIRCWEDTNYSNLSARTMLNIITFVKRKAKSPVLY
jgi:hypothetical protein